DLPLAERQRLAAARTHDLRHKSTESQIRAARAFLLQKGEALTQIAVGRVAGISRQTVATYRHMLDDVLKPVLRLATAKARNVKYGVYQVTAASVQRVLRFELPAEESAVLPILDG
ncbi:MAG: replication protein A, partial [Nitrosospira sp.]